MINYIKKQTQLLCLVLLLGCGVTTRASDFVTITAPAENSTVIGVPLSIAGTSSKPGFLVRLTINTTEIGSPTTDVNGNWSFASNDINNGQYIITAELLDGNSVVVATDTNSFTIQNPPTIFILSPADQDVVSNPLTVYGVSGLAFATVNLLIDNSIVATTTTDVSGNWSTFFNLTSNGVHALRANLIQTASTVASHTISITASIVVGATGPAGPAGPVGPTGATGAGPIQLIWANVGALTASTNNYMKIGTAAATLTEIQKVRVARNSTARNFWMNAGSAGIGITGTIRKNGFDTALTLFMSGTSGINGSNTVSFVPGDMITVKVATGSPVPTDVTVGVTLE